jgi:hypothetical protein
VISWRYISLYAAVDPPSASGQASSAQDEIFDIESSALPDSEQRKNFYDSRAEVAFGPSIQVL